MTTAAKRKRRAVLVAPASDARKAAKALASSADDVVLDLEDAVVPAAKHDARAIVHRVLSAVPGDRMVSVRINGLSTQWAAEDLELCVALGDKLHSIVVPKAETADQIEAVSAALASTSIGVQALIETPLGIANAQSIAGADPRMHTLILGYADLGSTLGRSADAGPGLWLAHQEAVLTAARIAGIAAVDGPWLAISDSPESRDWTRWVRDLGYDGKWVIHPGQIESVTKIFTPSAERVAYAHRVLSALADAESDGMGAVQLDGKMLDEAVAVAARRVLASQ